MFFAKKYTRVTRNAYGIRNASRRNRALTTSAVHLISLGSSLHIEPSYPDKSSQFALYSHRLPYISFLLNPGGKLRVNFSAFSLSLTFKVYKYLEHLILNLVTPSLTFFLIFTFLASFLRAFCKKSLMSVMVFGC